ncbi:FAD-dependent oxidoreductase [Streptomyces sp. MS1.HAVA.3]|uniref:FAD-dependent oxidoreductase n=1 Tax=Streptomyces caledonius TaxID=3134107 RepID=A0ABU8TZJ2_9ACTN
MEHVEAVVIGGGQSGLAAAHALVRAGLKPVVLEASDRAAGSWPHYYDSLTLFSRPGSAHCPACRSAGIRTATRTGTKSSPT